MGIVLQLIFLQFGGIPNPAVGRLNCSLWLLYLTNVTVQLLVTFISVLTIIVATFNINKEFHECTLLFPNNGAINGVIYGTATAICTVATVAVLNFMNYWPSVEKDSLPRFLHGLVSLPSIVKAAIAVALGALYGASCGAISEGSSFFAMVLPSLVFHPLIFEKLVAMMAILFTVLTAISVFTSRVLKKAASTIKHDGPPNEKDSADVGSTSEKYNNNGTIVLLFGAILGLPFFVVGSLYFVFFLCFIFGTTLYGAQIIYLAILVLFLFSGSSQLVRLALYFKIEGISIALPFGYKIPVIPEDALWWAKEQEDPQVQRAMDEVVIPFVEVSIALLALSPLIVFGSWTTFYIYLHGQVDVRFSFFSFPRNCCVEIFGFRCCNLTSDQY